MFCRIPGQHKLLEKMCLWHIPSNVSNPNALTIPMSLLCGWVWVGAELASAMTDKGVEYEEVSWVATGSVKPIPHFTGSGAVDGVWRAVPIQIPHGKGSGSCPL